MLTVTDFPVIGCKEGISFLAVLAPLIDVHWFAKLKMDGYFQAAAYVCALTPKRLTLNTSPTSSGFQRSRNTSEL